MFSQVIEEHIKKFLYLYAFLFSVVSSLILINSRIMVNTDGVVYLAATQAFLDGGISEAFTVDKNILLPMLIAGVHLLTNLSLVTSADIVNTLLMSSLVLAFIYLVKQLGGNRTVQLIAAILILLNPSLIGYRDSFFRDQGFWAFAILSVALLINYSNKQNFYSLGLWLACIGGATLFRPEAALFLLVPLTIFLTKELSLKVKLLKVGKVYLILVCLLVVGLFVLYLLNLDQLYIAGLEHLARYGEPSQVNVLSYGEMAQQFSNLFTYPYPDEYTWLGFGLSMLPIFMTSIVGAIGWPMLLVFIYCFYKKVLVFPKSNIYRAYAFISLIVLVIFLFSMFFITPRYSTFLGLLLIAALPFSLYKLYAGKQHLLKAKVITACCLFVLVIDCFVSFGYSTEYVAEGIDWVHINTPEDSRVISNERNITYSLEREKEYSDTQTVFSAWYKYDVKNVIANYDYFVEDTFYSREEILLDSIPNAVEIARFTSERGNRLVVYKLP